MRGFFGRLMRVDLEAESVETLALDDAVLERTLGGKGLGVHLLVEHAPTGAQPTDPASPFLIVTGPVTGTRLWSQSRFGVYAVSPATGGFGESYCGGTLAPKIKGCGIDAVLLVGRARRWVWLAFDESGLSLRDADDLVRLDTAKTERLVLERSAPGASAMTIGPAGEAGAVCACIKADRWRSLGRGGMGAVLGSKRVKALTFAGTRKAEIADPQLLLEVNRAVADKARQTTVTKAYQKLGTPMQVAVTNSQNCFPTRYWQSGHFEKWENLSAEYMQQHFDVRACGCPSCFLHCTKLARVRLGRHAGLELEGPEYETIYALGGLNAVDSLEEVAWLNDLCDRLGLDTMSAGNLSSFAIEAFRRGKTDFAIDYNQPDRMAELFGLIARGEGIGAVLARGIRPAAAEWGLEDLAVHVKGLEPAGFDPRVLKGMGLSYATSARGACHLRGTFYKAELSGQIGKDQIAGKARLHIDYEDRAALFDSLILCRFYRDFIGWDELAQIVGATTGLALGQGGLERLANRITQQTRRFNASRGLGSESDTLPPKLLKECTQEGASLSAEQLQDMIDEYNHIRATREAQGD